MNKKYPDLTKTIYQKYVYDIYNDDAFPEIITDSDKLNTSIKMPFPKKLNHGDIFVSSSKYQEWYGVAEEVEHLYSEIIADYNTGTINHAGIIFPNQSSTNSS